MKSLKQMFFIGLGSFLLFVCIGMSIASYFGGKNALDDTVHDSMLHLAREGKNTLEARIKANYETLQALTLRMDETSKKDIAGILKEVTEEMEYITMGVVDKNGDGILANGQKVNIAGKDYFKRALKGQEVITDPEISKDKKTAIITFAVPIKDDDGNIIGVLVATKDGLSISKIIDSITFGKSGKAFLINKQGVIIGHSDRNLVLNKSNDFENIKNDSKLKKLVELEEKAAAGEEGFGDYSYKGELRYAAYAPINVNGWSIMLEAPHKEVMENLRYIQIFTAITGLTFLIIALIFIYIIVSKISLDMNTIRKHLIDISNGTFKNKMPISFTARKDEMGDIAKAIDIVNESIRALISDIKNSANSVAVASEETSAISEQIASSSQNQSASTEQTLSSMEELDASIQDIEKNIQEVTENISSVTNLIKEMDTSVKNVANSMEHVGQGAETVASATEIGKDSVEKTMKGMERINEAMGSLVSVIKGLGTSAVDIGEIVDVIDDIAEQTNLLALNAAIEAARAGEHGKGFAVVAEAIRNLAEKSADATKEITKLIRHIQDEVGIAVNTVKTGAEEVEKGVQLAKETQVSLVNIEESVVVTANELNKSVILTQEQKKAIKIIVNDAESINSLAQTMAATVEEQTAASSEVVKAVENISQSAGQIAAGNGEIAKSTDSLAREAQNLSNVVSKYTV
ncbi:MAG: methyl-accepting chemotaxis protein [Ignavibacteriales bacterium]